MLIGRTLPTAGRRLRSADREKRFTQGQRGAAVMGGALESTETAGWTAGQLP